MRIRTTLTATGIALGLTVAGAAAANATQTPDGWSPATWTHRTMHSVSQDADPATLPEGYGRWGDGTRPEDATGDPTTCPYADDATADRLQDRDRMRLHDQDGTGAFDREQMRDRMHATS